MEVTLNRFFIGAGKLAVAARHKGSIEIDILVKILFPAGVEEPRRSTPCWWNAFPNIALGFG